MSETKAEYPVIEHQDHEQAAATKLKPCPFCGRPAHPEIQNTDSGPWFWVDCGQARAPTYECIAGPACSTPEAAIAAWNTRAAATGPAAIRLLMDEVLDMMLDVAADPSHLDEYAADVRGRLGTVLGEG